MSAGPGQQDVSAGDAAGGDDLAVAAGDTLGLLAGNGSFPLLLAREARARGCRIVAVAHRGETDESLEDFADSVTWIRVGQLGKMIKAFHRAGVTRAVMAGGINKVASLTSLRPDLRGLMFLRKVSGMGDDSILRALADELETEGIRVLPSTLFLERILAHPGLIAGPKPSRHCLDDVRLGCRVLTALGPFDVGQGIVVERGVVLAIEAVEGTDEMVRRAGRIGRGGAVVVKMAKRGQDMRFDVPAVGPTTIETMTKAHACVLAVQAGATILLDSQRMAELAAQNGISILGCTASGVVSGLSHE
ncbi:MAG TPA: UDP-2,3-diacylglucosamine diphosphatase LpxI [Candidatus Limnocylindrales bacterium]|nr:UDP-2,3-diacylglucosamine diphosphatase LpxI [Candidatus Limnocylindrales bacterium]